MGLPSSWLRCPACGRRPLDLDTQLLLCRGCRRAYPFARGIVNFLYPDRLPEAERRWQAEYNRMAASYDESLPSLERHWGFSEDRLRGELTARLGLSPGDAVLDLSVGTGRNLPHLAEAVRPDGRIVGVDFVPALLRHARRRAAGAPVEVNLVLANGAYLPFRDGLFAAVLHAGGLATSSEVPRFLAEAVRVARPGARLVFCEEGVPRWHREEVRFRRLVAETPLLASDPPLEDLPWDRICDVRLDWSEGEVFYILAFRKRP